MAEVSQDPNLKSGVVVPKDVATQLANMQEINRFMAASTTPPESVYGFSSNGSSSGSSTKTDEWIGKSYQIDPLKDINKAEWINKSLNVYQGIIDTLKVTVEVLTLINQLINVFQSDIDNLFKVLNAAIQLLIDAIEKLLISIASTGVYALPLMPDISPFDPEYKPGGGFDAVMAKVNHALTNQNDPNRPIFVEGDFVGAIIFVLTAGTNVGDLIHDLEVLSKLLKMEGFTGYATGPVGLAAKPGLFSSNKGVLDSLKSAISGEKKLGIEISWGSTGIPGTSSFDLYRSKVPGGVPALDNKGKAIPGFPNEFNDALFNGGKPVEIEVDEDDPEAIFSYIDFEVSEGETYYYKVVPGFRYPDGNYTAKAESISGFVSAKAVACIPDDLLTSSYETPDGLRIGPATGEKPYWSSLTLRGLLGESFDTLLFNLNMMADRLKGVTVSSSEHFEKQIKALKKWIKKLTDILNALKDVLESLQKLRLSTAAMMLAIPSESGGIEGLKRRINAAVPGSDNLKKYLEENNSLCNVYGGFMLVVGCPTATSFKNVGAAAVDGAKAVATAASFENTVQTAKDGWDKTKGAVGNLDYVKNTNNDDGTESVMSKDKDASKNFGAERAVSFNNKGAKDADVGSQVMGFLTGILAGS